MKQFLKTLVLIGLFISGAGPAQALTFGFEYIKPFKTEWGTSFRPALWLEIDDSALTPGGHISGYQESAWYDNSHDDALTTAVPHEGVLPGHYELVRCRPTVPDGLLGSCSVAAAWITRAERFGFNLEVKGNVLFGDIDMWFEDQQMSTGSDRGGIWYFGFFGTEWGMEYWCDDCNATGRWRRVPVPEPGSLALLGLGLAGLGLSRRRRAA